MSQQILNQFRCDKKLRDDCVKIYSAIGMDLNTAFRMFMERTRMVGGLPFPAVLPTYERITKKEAQNAFYDLRDEASTLPEIDFEDINGIISMVREERKAKK